LLPVKLEPVCSSISRILIRINLSKTLEPAHRLF
jgi:hypothetical protein